MTVRVLLSKDTKTGIYSARVKGNGQELGKNLLVAARKTKKIDEAKTHTAEALKTALQGIEPTIIYELPPQ